MRTFLTILFVLFIIVFIGQKSHVIEKKTAMETNLGVERDEYHVNFGNLTKYLSEIPGKIKNISDQIKKKLPQKKTSP